MKTGKNSKVTGTTKQEIVPPFSRTFSSSEEADRYTMIANLEKSDKIKFEEFCNMLRLQQLYQRAKIYDRKDIK